MTKKLDLPEKNIFINDYENMKSVSAMARKYNVTTPTIRKWLHTFGAKRYTHYETIEARRKNRFPVVEKIKYDIDSIEDIIKNISNDLGIEIQKISDNVFKLSDTIYIKIYNIMSNSEYYGGRRMCDLINESKNYEKIGVKLITIFESDWINKKEIVKSIIRHKLGKTENVIPARNTIVKKLNYSDIKQFEIDNHIQGTRPAKDYYGLFFNDILVMSLSIGKSRYNKKYENELVRMTVAKNMHVQGGVSKLLKYSGVSNCLTYVDLKFGTGISYSKAGMKFIGTSRPGFHYFHKSDSNTLYSRTKFQKFKIKDADFNKSGYKNMLDKGYDRIWDCGNAIYAIT